MAVFSTSLRNLARKTYIKIVLGIEPVWRYTLNLAPTLRFKRNQTQLNTRAAGVVDQLNENGAARTNLSDLTGNTDLFEELKQYAYELEAQQELEIKRRSAQLAAKDDLGNGQAEKAFVVTMLDHDRPAIDPDNVLARIALDPQIKGIADRYYGMETFVTDINIWRNLPTGREATASQLWHRDLRSDYLILKMFIYIEDVDDGAGPYSYIKGTHAKGDLQWRPNASFDGYNWRATDADVAAATAVDKPSSFPGDAGTVLFSDTTGWHKGGHAKTSSRFVVQVLFSSKAALPDRMLGVPANVDLREAPKALAYDRKAVAS